MYHIYACVCIVAVPISWLRICLFHIHMYAHMRAHTRTHMPCIYYLNGLDYEGQARSEEFHESSNEWHPPINRLKILCTSPLGSFTLSPSSEGHSPTQNYV